MKIRLKHHSGNEQESYFSRIGRLGGQSGKGSPARQKSAKNAAIARWESEAKVSGKLVITVERRYLTFSYLCPELERVLQFVYRQRKGHSIEAKKTSFLSLNGETHSAPLPFLTAIEKALKKFKIKYRVTWNRPRPPRAQFTSMALAGLRTREVRALRTLRRLPFGGVLIANNDRLNDLLISIVMSYTGHRVVVVINSLHQLSGMRFWLQQNLNEPVGALTGLNADSERVVLTTPYQLQTPVISTCNVGLLVFMDPPRKVGRSVEPVFRFEDAFRVAITSVRISPPYSVYREVLFGPEVPVPA